MAGDARTATLIAVAGALLAGFGLAEGAGEITPYLAATDSPTARVASLADGHYRPGDSLWSRDQFFRDCLDLPQIVLMPVQPLQRQADFARRCRDAAEAAVADTPIYSAAWLTVATTAAALGDLPAMRAALLASAQTGPELAWLAERRSSLALAHLAELDDAGRAAYHADLAALARTAAGLDLLAARYASDPAQRDGIAAAVEAASPATQSRFLDRVRDRASAP